MPPPAAETVTDGTALLAAVLAAPEDDAPRLVYADWCSENGREEYGEFIRVQCELGRLKQVQPQAPAWFSGGPEYDEHRKTVVVPLLRFRRRERELWEAGAERWFKATGLATVRYEGQGVGYVRPVGFVRRGFVAEVGLPVAEFVGGPCGRCGGTGDETSDGQGTCGTCKGKRTVPGLAADLFRTHPVVDVRLTDREPAELEKTGEHHGLRNPFFMWQYYTPDDDAPHRLPKELADILFADSPELCRGRWPHWRGETINTFYQTPDAAHAALSAACVAFGRSQAGLEG